MGCGTHLPLGGGMSKETPPPVYCRRGFTLAEVLAVLTIMGILAAVAAPRFASVLQVNHVERALDGVTADLSLARIHAVREGRPAKLRINATGTGYDVIAGTKSLKTVSLVREHPGVLLAPAGDSIVFNSRGLRELDAASTIISRKGDKTRTVMVSGIGRVYRVD